MVDDQETNEGKLVPNTKLNKARIIRELASEGLSIGQIQIKLGEMGIEVRYQHIYNTLKYSRELKNEEEAGKARKAKIGVNGEPLGPREHIPTPHQLEATAEAAKDARKRIKEREDSPFLGHDIDTLREELRRFGQRGK